MFVHAQLKEQIFTKFCADFNLQQNDLFHNDFKYFTAPYNDQRIQMPSMGWSDYQKGSKEKVCKCNVTYPSSLEFEDLKIFTILILNSAILPSWISRNGFDFIEFRGTIFIQSNHKGAWKQPKLCMMSPDKISHHKRHYSKKSKRKKNSKCDVNTDLKPVFHYSSHPFSLRVCVYIYIYSLHWKKNNLKWLHSCHSTI